MLLLSGDRSAPAGDGAIPTVILTDDVFEPSDYRTAVRARLPSHATAAEVVSRHRRRCARLSCAHRSRKPTRLFAHPTVPQSPAPLVEEFTPRELQVLRDVARGLANKEIADRIAYQ